MGRGALLASGGPFNEGQASSSAPAAGEPRGRVEALMLPGGGCSGCQVLNENETGIFMGTCTCRNAYSIRRSGARLCCLEPLIVDVQLGHDRDVLACAGLAPMGEHLYHHLCLEAHSS